jgi:hypothetical protein
VVTAVPIKQKHGRDRAEMIVDAAGARICGAARYLNERSQR